MTWLAATSSKAAVQECGVALLSVLAVKGLAGNLQLRSPQLWSLSVLRQGPLSSAAASLVQAAFAGGHPSASSCIFVDAMSLSPVCSA